METVETTVEAHEIWVITSKKYGYLMPIDDDGVPSFLAYCNRKDAETALQSQAKKGYIELEDWYAVKVH